MHISSVLLVVVTASLTALVSSSPFPPQVAGVQTSRVVYGTLGQHPLEPFYHRGSNIPMYPRGIPVESPRHKRQIMGAGLGGSSAQSQSQAQSMGAGMGAGMMGAGLYNPFMMGMGMPFFG